MFKAKEDMKTMSDVFSVYKKELGYSFLEISKISGISKGYISNRNQSDDFDIAFMNKVKFKSLVDEHPDKRAPSATVNPKDLKFLNLVSVKLARKKLDCKSGFGLCDFKFFPKNTTVKSRRPIFCCLNSLGLSPSTLMNGRKTSSTPKSFAMSKYGDFSLDGSGCDIRIFFIFFILKLYMYILYSEGCRRYCLRNSLSSS
jgi:hypothetical protein